MQKIIFDTEWGHEWPLWADSPAEEPLLFPEDLQLSVELMEELRRFYDFWEVHDRPEQGWDLPSAQEHSVTEAERLVRLLNAELDGRYKVTNQFGQTRGRRWPV